MALVTLITDYGHRDASAAIAKGVLMQYVPLRNIVELSHEVLPYKIADAAYLLRRALDSMPAGTCHIAMLDLFNSENPVLLLADVSGQYILTSDNGLLPSLGITSAAQCYAMAKEDTAASWLAAAGRLVQGISSGQIPGYSVYIPASATSLAPITKGMELHCDVIAVDGYGNVTTNITRELFQSHTAGRPFRLEFTMVEEINDLSTGYNDVRPGYKLCRFNSSGYLEICVNKGRAATLFGLRPGSIHNNIKLIIE